MTYVVGYSPHKDDQGALELACEFARSQAAPLRAVTVVPHGWGTPVAGDTDREYEQWAAAEGEASAKLALQHLAKHPDIEVEAVWVSARSVPQALLEQAETVGAQLLVVGSGDSAERGRVALSSKTERLLHSSSVMVALAPRDYRPEPDSRITRVTLAFRDDDATWQLLDRAAEICRQVGAELRLVTVAVKQRSLVTSPVRGDEKLVYAQLLGQVQSAQAEAVDHLAKVGMTAAAEVAGGESWAEALATVSWRAGDLMVVGSSRTHPLANVFLGSSASKIARNSPVPVLVVP